MFHSARIKLTTWYLLIMFVVSSFFSLAVYRMLSLEVDRFVAMQKSKMERRMLDPDFLPYEMRQRFPTPPIAFVIERELVNETKARIALSLLVVDGAILAISGMLAYFLAGKTLKPISDMVEEQKRFIGDASHELRTPLTALKSAIEVNLRDKNMSLDDAKDLLTCAKDQVDRLTHLSNSLLELTKHDLSGTYEDRIREKINVGSVVEQVVSEMSNIGIQKSVSIKTNIKESFVFSTNHDIYRLATILIENAIKYSKPDTEVEVTVYSHKKHVHIKVKDHGIGISEEDKKRVFDRFYRADAARNVHGTNGYGLGLAIAKKIVDSYKGKIDVKSKSGIGSEFIVTLPMVKVDQS